MTALIADWREKQLNIILENIQKSIHSLQSLPQEKCKNENKYHCITAYGGFGYQLHLLMSCLLEGFYKKTLVIINVRQPVFGNYLKDSNSKWDQFISPISESCQPNSSFTYKIESKRANVFAYGQSSNYILGLFLL